MNTRNLIESSGGEPSKPHLRDPNPRVSGCKENALTMTRGRLAKKYSHLAKVFGFDLVMGSWYAGGSIL